MKKDNKIVEIFSTPVCHYCHMAKDWFAQNKIEFTDYDVTKDSARRQELIDLGAMGVPLIRISEKENMKSQPAIINGFDVAHLEEILVG